MLLDSPASRAGRADVRQILRGGVVQAKPIKDQNPPLPRRKPPSPSRLGGGPRTPPLCSGRVVVTAQYRSFVKDIGTLIGKIPGLGAAERKRRARFAKQVLSTEGSADIDRYTVVSCTKINSPLLLKGESAGAYVDVSKRELGLSTATFNLMSRFRRTHAAVDLSKFLQTIAHEKRHVTLGTAAQVPSSGVRSGRAPGHVSYRVEEILTVAEEIAVARRFQGRRYTVPLSVSMHIHRLRNLLRGWVTPAEFTRLRGVIITQLRSRYGFANNCDNALVFGVITAMDHGQWRMCSSNGRLVGRAPAGLRNCVGPRYDSACGNPKP